MELYDLEFDFDSLGRLTSETNSNKTIGYDYDLVGNRTQIINSNSTIIDYSYDQNNRLTQISSPHPNTLPEGEGTGIIATYEYDSLSLLSKTLGNNLTTNYGYDELLRLKSLNNYNYTYNTQGNITSNGTDTYTYDSLDRITNTIYQTKHNKRSAENFEYDLMGNRSLETLTSVNKKGKEKQKKFSYDTNNLNQYLDITGTSPQPSPLRGEGVDTEVTGTGETEEIELEGRLLYDNNGNLTGNMLNNKRQYIYSYDYKNRLVTIEKNIYKKKKKVRIEKIVEIRYDVLGRRIQKLFNNGSYRNYYYSNQDIILEENYSKKGKLKNSKEFIYSNSLDDILSMNVIAYKTRKIQEEYVNSKGKTKTRKIKEQYIETNTYFYQKDHLGSIIAITDETGSIVEEYAYDVFGKPYTKKSDGTITSLKKSKIGNTRMYTGREYDRGLKLYYNRARYYNPKLGRFISRDPIDIADDVNLYAYVGNNGVMFVDRMGKEKTLIIGFSGYSGPKNYYFDDAHDTAVYLLLEKLGKYENIETNFLQSSPFGGDVRSALKTINEGDYNKLIIIGHSWGSDSALELANKLDYTDLLITIDTCGGTNCLFGEREISSNVQKTINYYQMNDFNNSDTPAYALGGYVLMENHIEKRAYGENFNQDITNIEMKKSTHTSIDEDVSDKVYNIILNQLGIK